jgi:integrase
MSSSSSSRWIVPHSSKLKAANLKDKTRLQYNNKLLLFLQHTNLTLQQLSSHSRRTIDRWFAAWLDHYYEHEHGKFTYASWAFNSLKHHLPYLQGHMYESASRLRGWDRLHESTSTSHPPLTWELSCVISGLFLSWHDIPSAICVILGFHCYLRISEVVNLRAVDIARRHDPRLGGAHVRMAIALPDTKSGKNHYVSITDESVATILTVYLNSRHFHPHHRVFPFTEPEQLRQRFRMALSALNITHARYVFHSLRHGGASSDHLKGHTIEQIVFRGRWKSIKSATRYIQTGRAIMHTVPVPPQLNELGHVMSQYLLIIFQCFLSP